MYLLLHNNAKELAQKKIPHTKSLKLSKICKYDYINKSHMDGSKNKKIAKTLIALMQSTTGEIS